MKVDFRMLPATFLGLIFALLPLSCHIGSNEEERNVFTFPSLADSLGGADYALILLKDSLEQTVDTLFDGPVTPMTTFAGLPADRLPRGVIVLAIEGRAGGKSGSLVYKVDKRFDNETDQSLSITTHLTPSSKVRLMAPPSRMHEGDSIPMPEVSVSPSTLVDQSLAFFSRRPDLLIIRNSDMKAVGVGLATVIVSLKAYPAKVDSFTIEIVSRTTPLRPIDSLSLNPNPLILAVRGPTFRLRATAHPISVAVTVTFRAEPEEILAVSQEGVVSALAPGGGRVIATSTLDTSLKASTRIKVLPAQNVDSIAFERDSVEIFAQGSAWPLTVRVFPPLANQEATFELLDKSIATLQAGLLQGGGEGETMVVARSTEDSGRTDTLRVVILPAQKVDSVRLKEENLRLYVNGAARMLTAGIYPMTLQKRFLWSSSRPEFAEVDDNGKIHGIEAGEAYVTVRARADGTVHWLP